MSCKLEDLYLTEGELHDLVRNENGHSISYKIERFSEDSMGFLANHFRLTLHTKDTTLTFFVKTVPKIGMNAKYVEDIGAFKKEVVTFRELMKELQDTSNKQWSPICHLAKDDVLVFEDLTIKRYINAGYRGMLNLYHTKAAVATLARLHAASIIWEKNNGKISEKHPNIVKEIGYSKESAARVNWLKITTEALYRLSQEMGFKVDKSKFAQNIHNLIDTVAPSKDKLNVLSHGDLWTNNLMFTYSDAGSIENCVIVDYQLLRYAPCAIDLVCMLILILTKDDRIKYFDLLCEEYYSNLANILSEHSINLESLMKKTNFRNDCKFYKPMGVLEACLFGTIIFLPPSLCNEVLSSESGCYELTQGNRYKICLQAFHEDEFYKMKMTELLGDFVDSFEAQTTQ